APSVTASPAARPTARVVVIPAPTHATPTLPAAPRHAVSRSHRRHAARPGALPNLGVHIGRLPTPPPSATATSRPTPTATPRPTPRPSATPRPTATATPSPTATTRPNPVQIPL